MLSSFFRSFLENKISGVSGQRSKLLNLVQVDGGDSNESFIVETNTGAFFLKLNQDTGYPDFFSAEADGLNALSGKSQLIIPKPLINGTCEGQQFLLMEFLRNGRPSVNFWEDFGRGLAVLHNKSNAYFGWEKDNYIGSLPQQNKQQTSWSKFYTESRILLLIRAASEIGNDPGLIGLAENFCQRLPQLFPEEKPALLHGDLWSGNFMVHESGRATVFDPSVYYGHREMDLAMTRLFGGFDNRFYAAYEEAFPLQPGWRERIPLFQLYPLLVHTILFGGHYYDSVKSVLKKFS